MATTEEAREATMDDLSYMNTEAIRVRYANMTDAERENERYTLTVERETIGMSKAEAEERLFWLDGAGATPGQAEPDGLTPCGHCRRCAIHDDPAGCLEVEAFERGLEAIGAFLREAGKRIADHLAWLQRKEQGREVAELLAPLPEGAEFTLGWEAGRAYRATYRKNAEGLWDQVRGTCEAPHVVNMDAAHLGFVVGVDTVLAALSA
jgi:hypothetical protein